MVSLISIALVTRCKQILCLMPSEVEQELGEEQEEEEEGEEEGKGWVYEVNDEQVVQGHCHGNVNI